jgi:D-alanyl-D-alanine carboxypeptidase (penicillin-binding protein 5/6)
MRNTNRLLWSEADLVGGKTGYTHSAQHCFVCAAERGSDTVIVALLGSPSRDTLWRESEFLISKGFSVMENNDEPQIYLTSANYDDIVIEKAVHKKSSKKKIKSYKKKKSHKTMIAKKHKGKKKADKKLMAKKHKGKKKTILAKKKGKGKTKALAKKKIRKKNYRVAEKNKNGRTKG